MNSLFKWGLGISLSIAFSFIAIEIVQNLTGRRYKFLECKDATLIYHSEWTPSEATCSIVRIKNGRQLAIVVDSTEEVELSKINSRILADGEKGSHWVHWATVKTSIIYLRSTKTGVDFIKWRDGFAIVGHALAPGYKLDSPSSEDAVVNWHISNVRRTAPE